MEADKRAESHRDKFFDNVLGSDSIRVRDSLDMMDLLALNESFGNAETSAAIWSKPIWKVNTTAQSDRYMSAYEFIVTHFWQTITQRVGQLLNAGLDPDCQSNETVDDKSWKRRPIHLAIAHAEPELFRRLLAVNANLQLAPVETKNGDVWVSKTVDQLIEECMRGAQSNGNTPYRDALLEIKDALNIYRANQRAKSILQELDGDGAAAAIGQSP